MKQNHLHIHSLSCAEIYTHLCDNLDSKLDSESCRRIKSHIAECKNCTALLDSLKKTVSLYRTYPAPKLPASLKKELFAVIHVGKGRVKKSPRR